MVRQVGGSITLEDALAPLRVQASGFDLRPLTGDLIDQATEVVKRDFHASDHTPFSSGWSNYPPLERSRRYRRWLERSLKDGTSAKANIVLGLMREDVFMGSTNCLITQEDHSRTVTTGSWIVLEQQGKGIGTSMREMALILAFDALRCTRAISSAFSDNHASNAVNLRTGYHVSSIEHRGDRRLVHYELLASEHQTRLRSVHIEGAELLRAFFS